MKVPAVFVTAIQALCLLVSLIADGDPPAEEVAEEVRSMIERAVVDFDDGYPDVATDRLYDARNLALRLDDPALRNELVAAVLEVVQERDEDGVFNTRLEFCQEQAAEFLELAQDVAEDQRPASALVILDVGAEFDRDVVRDEQLRCEQQKGRLSADDAAQDRELAAGLTYFTTLYTALDKRDEKSTKDKTVKRLLKLMTSTSEASQKMAKTFQRKRRVENAFGVSAIGASVFLDHIRDDYRVYYDAVREARAERRFVRWAEPFMTDFESAHRTGLTRKRKWKVDEREITAPPPAPGDTLLVSEATVSGDYELEVDFRFPDMTGTVHVVVAHASDDDFCTLEFERPRGRTYFLRFCHYRDGVRSVLAESDEGPQTLAGWHTLSMSRTDGIARSRFGKAELEAELPTKGDVAYGFFEVGGEKPKKKSKDKKPVSTSFRNLIIRSP